VLELAEEPPEHEVRGIDRCTAGGCVLAQEIVERQEPFE
jgi:hypothetical protein